MYHHVKKLMYRVRVDQPDARFGRMLLEQFGGANGELAAALQYTIQGLNCDDVARKDMLLDIGTEELSHLEIIGSLARMHLKPLRDGDSEAVLEDPLIAIVGGGGVSLNNSKGNPWTADYLKISGQLEVDLRNNIAAEARAKITYERLLDHCDCPGSKDALMFLMSREIAHMKVFAAALESMNLDPFEIGEREPDQEIVQKYFNDSTGSGELGQDSSGPWTELGACATESNPHGGAPARRRCVAARFQIASSYEELAAPCGDAPGHHPANRLLWRRLLEGWELVNSPAFEAASAR